jgi:hypothetical protein
MDDRVTLFEPTALPDCWPPSVNWPMATSQQSRTHLCGFRETSRPSDAEIEQTNLKMHKMGRLCRAYQGRGSATDRKSQRTKPRLCRLNRLYCLRNLSRPCSPGGISFRAGHRRRLTRPGRIRSPGLPYLGPDSVPGPVRGRSKSGKPAGLRPIRVSRRRGDPARCRHWEGGRGSGGVVGG